MLHAENELRPAVHAVRLARERRRQRLRRMARQAIAVEAIILIASAMLAWFFMVAPGSPFQGHPYGQTMRIVFIIMTALAGGVTAIVLLGQWGFGD